MVSYLPLTDMEFLLSTYSHIWPEYCFTFAWREAMVIPILESSRDHSLLASYGHISLSSYVCKTMEHMVYHQFMWSLESRNFLSNTQYGFKWHRFTLDHLMNMKHRIQNYFITRQHPVMVLLNLRKTYDTTSCYSILRTLHLWNLRGWRPLFPRAFSRIVTSMFIEFDKVLFS
jgi:potassium voltage-gated channel Eag-related subfamily H protein 8